VKIEIVNFTDRKMFDFYCAMLGPYV